MGMERGAGDYAGSTTVTTAAFLNALKAQIGNYILPVRRLPSTKPSSGSGWAWLTCSLFLPGECEIFGENARGDFSHDDGLKIQFPIYQKATTYRCKKYNGIQYWYWECSPDSGSAAYFCFVISGGSVTGPLASRYGGCSSIFCVA
jgi:hypothetical protein